MPLLLGFFLYLLAACGLVGGAVMGATVLFSHVPPQQTARATEPIRTERKLPPIVQMKTGHRSDPSSGAKRVVPHDSAAARIKAVETASEKKAARRGVPHFSKEAQDAYASEPRRSYMPEIGAF